MVERIILPGSHGSTVTLTLHRNIGTGSYAQVYTATMNNSRNGADSTVYACKVINLTPDTNRCFLEAAIMACIVHPFIASAHKVFWSDSRLLILQELAVSDLQRLTNGTAANRLAWSHQLCQAVACLHGEGIIHGDLKASNVLVYADEIARLTDFSISVKRWNGAAKFHDLITTPSHRAPEVFRREGWDESADVWSLGCTLYEICHGAPLFSQRHAETEKKSEEDVYRQIVAWCSCSDARMNPWGPQFVSESPTVACTTRASLMGGPLDDLIGRCLRFDPSERATAAQILSHHAFDGLTIQQYCFKMMAARPFSALSGSEELSRELDIVSTSTPLGSSVRALAVHLLCRCEILLKTNSPRLLATAAHRIASRLMFSAIAAKTPDDVVLAERAICHHLAFAFLKSSKA